MQRRCDSQDTARKLFQGVTAWMHPHERNPLFKQMNRPHHRGRTEAGVFPSQNVSRRLLLIATW